MPEAPRILILGGYGSTGRCLSRLLLANCGVEVTIAGRNENRAAALASQLGSSCRFACVDASDPLQLHHAILRHALVILAAPGEALPGVVARVALDCGADYLDIVYGSGKLTALRALASRAESEGRCLVTEAGFHPGLPSLLVRWAAHECGGALRSAEVASVLRPHINNGAEMPESMDELVDGIFHSKSVEYEAGQWRRLEWWQWPYRRFDFGRRWGNQLSVPLDFEELHAVAESMPGLERLRFLMAGFGFVTDWLVMPAIMGLQAVSPRWSRPGCSRLLWESLRHFTPQPHGTALAIRYEGMDGHRGFLALEHADEYMFTAIPVVAYLRQWLDGKGRRPGLHYMGMLADPVRLMASMQRMGIATRAV